MAHPTESHQPEPIDRRRFIYLATSTGVAAALLPSVVYRPAVAAELSSNRWSDPATWDGRIPGSGERVTIRKPVLIDQDVKVGGLHVAPGGALMFHPDQSVTLQSAGNVIVEGMLILRPGRSSVTHRLTFVGIDESRFVGGGMNPVDTDWGLWVMGQGTLDLAGTPKLPWTRASGSLRAGSKVIDLHQDPINWRPGDELVVTPTLPPTSPNYASAYDTVRVASVSGRRITLDRALAHDHPLVRVGRGLALGAEVLNLSRNVLVGGTPSGRTHTLLRSTQTQNLSYARFEHFGPHSQSEGLISAKDGKALASPVMGRYAVHFHHMGEAARGSLVEGCVATKGGNHAFAAHLSHGVTFRGCITHDTTLAPYWWDAAGKVGDPDDRIRPTDHTNDTRYVSCVASRWHAMGFGRVRRRDGTAPQPNLIARVGGFDILSGARNSAVGCVAVGGQGGRDMGGFTWQEGAAGAHWHVFACVAHNIRGHGYFAWNNNPHVHTIEQFISYHNGEHGFMHGAYGNNYHFIDCIAYGNRGNAVEMSATSNDGPNQQTWTRLLADPAGIGGMAIFIPKHKTPPSWVDKKTRTERNRTRMVNCVFEGRVAQDPRQITGNWNLMDFEFCTFNEEVKFGTSFKETVWRFQTSREAYQLTNGGRAGIASFSKASPALLTSLSLPLATVGTPPPAMRMPEGLETTSGSTHDHEGHSSEPQPAGEPGHPEAGHESGAPAAGGDGPVTVEILPVECGNSVVTLVMENRGSTRERIRLLLDGRQVKKAYLSARRSGDIKRIVTGAWGPHTVEAVWNDQTIASSSFVTQPPGSC